MQRPFNSLAPLTVVCLLLPGAAWAESKSAAPDIVAPGPKSTFVDEVDFGKDPFFPRSTRRPKVIVRATNPEPSSQVVPDFIVLKGISVIKDRKLAIINYYTAAEGEEFPVRFNGQSVVRVKCVEIKDRSVIVSVNGALKELPLRAGL